MWLVDERVGQYGGGETGNKLATERPLLQMTRIDGRGEEEMEPDLSDVPTPVAPFARSKFANVIKEKTRRSFARGENGLQKEEE